MERLLAYEWRVMRYVHSLRASAINNRTYSSEENAQRACDRLNACDDNLDNRYTPIKVRVVADVEPT